MLLVLFCFQKLLILNLLTALVIELPLECSVLLGTNSSANTFPYIKVENSTSQIEHEASTSKIGEEQIFYFLQRGIDLEQAISLIISGFCKGHDG